MSTKRHGNRVVSDLSKAILFVIKRGAQDQNEVIDLLGNSYSDTQIRKRIYGLTSNKLVAVKPNRGLKITDKGLAALDNLKLKSIDLRKPWDHQWRIVMYDIPEDKRQARDKVRLLLKELGFMQLQISVWVHPLPCLNQFQAIRQAYGISKHMYLFEVNDSSDFDDLRSKFSKQYPRVKLHYLSRS